MTKIPCVYIINEKLYVSCPSIIALIKKIHVIRLGGEVLAETFEKKITADEFWKISWSSIHIIMFDLIKETITDYAHGWQRVKQQTYW